MCYNSPMEKMKKRTGNMNRATAVVNGPGLRQPISKTLRVRYCSLLLLNAPCCSLLHLGPASRPSAPQFMCYKSPVKKMQQQMARAYGATEIFV